MSTAAKSSMANPVRIMHYHRLKIIPVIPFDTTALDPHESTTGFFGLAGFGQEPIRFLLGRRHIGNILHHYIVPVARFKISILHNAII